MKTLKRFVNSSLVILKDQQWFDRQTIAGRCVAEVLQSSEELIKSEKDLSLKDLENNADAILKKYNCEPTFHGYQGFPSKICTSVNKQLVHGIVTDYKLKPGDLITVDLGATYEGAIADAARTWIFQEPKDVRHVEMLDVCKKSLDLAISKIEIGKNLGIIGHTIFNYVRKSQFGLITNYGGHGLDYNKAHSTPFVENKSKESDGIVIQNGLSIAIEPMVVIGEAKTYPPADDGWTIYTPNIGCHFENSVTVFNDVVHVMTNYEN